MEAHICGSPDLRQWARACAGKVTRQRAADLERGRFGLNGLILRSLRPENGLRAHTGGEPALQEVSNAGENAHPSRTARNGAAAPGITLALNDVLPLTDHNDRLYWPPKGR
jgi:hypothetical protein